MRDVEVDAVELMNVAGAEAGNPDLGAAIVRLARLAAAVHMAEAAGLVAGQGEGRRAPVDRPRAAEAGA